MHSKQSNTSPTTRGGITLTSTSDVKSLEAFWRKAEAEHNTTVFQTFEWCTALLRNSKVESHIVLGHAANGTLEFLIPFQLAKNKLQFLGQPNSIYGYGIFSNWALGTNGQDWFAQNWPLILRHGHDAKVTDLRDMPSHMNGAPNPLLHAANIRDANTCTILNLGSDFEEMLKARRSAVTRSKMRNRDRHMAEHGEILFEELAATPEAHAALDELLADQAARLSEKGVSDPINAEYRATLHELLDGEGSPLKVLRLKIGTTTGASMLMAYQADKAIFLMISLTESPLRKFAPGDVALRRGIAHAIAQGCKTFDFYHGAFNYKESWEDELISLHHCIRSCDLAGLPSATLLSGKQSLKSAIKSNPLVWNSATAIRRLLRGRKSG